MKKYEKINSIFKRDEDGVFTNEISIPEFEYLWNNKWVFTEKIDGTNIRVIWDEENLEFKGRTDKAETPKFLLEKLGKLFTKEKMREQFEDTSVCLYGEGYGARINKGGKYISDDVSFILFDVKIGNWWLKREDVERIAKELGIEVVPIVGEGTLKDAIELIKSKSLKSKYGDFLPEGIVMKPMVELVCRNGKRIISKLKHSDLEKGLDKK